MPIAKCWATKNAKMCVTATYTVVVLCARSAVVYAHTVVTCDVVQEGIPFKYGVQKVVSRSVHCGCCLCPRSSSVCPHNGYVRCFIGRSLCMQLLMTKGGGIHVYGL